MGTPDAPNPDHSLVAALRASEERFRTICEHAPVMIDQFDERGRCVLWNRECERTLGYTHEDLTGTENPLALTYPDPADQRRVLESIRRADGHFREYEVRAKDGSTRIQMWADFALPNGSRISVGHDITAQRRTEHELASFEEQLVQHQKMEAVGQLTGGIAHDFNNLLTVIRANADLLERRAARGYTDLGDVTREIVGATERGAELVRKLLAFSRQERLTLSAVNLGALVRDIVPTLRRLLPETIRVELDAHDRLPTVRADPCAVQQMLINLATNARDAMPGPGKLRIVAQGEEIAPKRAHTLGLTRAGAYGVLTVRDTGTGMDERVRIRAFEPFFTTKPSGAGTGLGLAMVYGLARQHGGAVEIESAPDRGTCVRVLLPLADPLEHSVPRPPEGSLAGSETILLVEDEAPIRTAAAAVLTDAGYRVLTAADGVEALSVLETNGDDIDLVISDVVMPRMSGPQLLAAARESGYAPRFVFTSGYPTRDAGADSVDPSVHLFAKPWSADDLLREIRAALDDRSR